MIFIPLHHLLLAFPEDERALRGCPILSAISKPSSSRGISSVTERRTRRAQFTRKDISPVRTTGYGLKVPIATTTQITFI